MIKAALLVLEKDGKVMFVRRSKKSKSLPGRWALPSETWEEGETIQETATRGAKEELDLVIDDPELIDEVHYKDGKEDKELYFFKIKYNGHPTLMVDEYFAEIRHYTFEEFFEKHSDAQIGHGLQYLRSKRGEGL